MSEPINPLNAVLAALGPLHWPLALLGAVGLITGPFILWHAFSGSRRTFAKKAFASMPRLRLIVKANAVALALAYALAAFFIFPGMLFCSVFCLGIVALPLLALPSTSGLLLLLFMYFAAEWNE